MTNHDSWAGTTMPMTSLAIDESMEKEMEMQLYQINGTLNLYSFCIVFLLDNALRDVLRFIILLYFLIVVVGFGYYNYIFFDHD
jgi:hypothetical protein